MALGALLILGMASCEMRNEIWGDANGKKETGRLKLGVSVRTPVSQTRTVTQVTDFPVNIKGTGTDVADVVREYASVSEIPDGLLLPVGDYTITSHTPGELRKQMTAPYYSGSLDMKISKNITTEAGVVCKMRNSRIRLEYGDDFKSSFQSWSITVDDGSNTALAFDHSDTGSTPTYWAFDEDAVTSINVNIRAVTKAGNTVSESRTFKKSDAAEKYDDVTDFFNGGDALDIRMGAVESATGEVRGITLAASITFENHDEPVEIPVGGEENPEPTPDPEPGEGGPALTLPDDVSYSINATEFPAADALITASAGLKSIVVTISAGNDGFDSILQDLSMDGQSFKNGGVDLVDNSDFNTLLESVGLPEGPQAGDTRYTFPIGVFFTFLNVTGITDTGKTHQFNIVITDKNGASVKGTFNVIITE